MTSNIHPEAQKVEAGGHEFSTFSDEQELVPGTTSIMRNITNAVVIKDEDMFFLCDPEGSVPLEAGHGFGLYYHDCRYLNGYDLRLSGRKPDPLVWTADQGFLAVLGLANSDLRMTDSRVLPKHSIEIKWSRLISSEYLTLFDEIELRSLTFQPVEFIVSLTFRSAFEDVFSIRGLFQGQRGKLHHPAWENHTLRFDYDGADKLYRSLKVHFAPIPDGKNQDTAFFRIALQPKESRQLLVSLQL